MKSIKNLAMLGMLVILGACSLSEEDKAFFELVKGKKVILVSDNSTVGTFSTDGQTFIEEITVKDEFSFDGLVGSTASYLESVKGVEIGYKITTTDGKTGTMNIVLLGQSSSTINIKFE